MQKEYDLTKLKVKRCGSIKGFHGVPEAPEVKPSKSVKGNPNSPSLVRVTPFSFHTSIGITTLLFSSLSIGSFRP